LERVGMGFVDSILVAILISMLCAIAGLSVLMYRMDRTTERTGVMVTDTDKLLCTLEEAQRLKYQLSNLLTAGVIDSESELGSKLYLFTVGELESAVRLLEDYIKEN
jgi:hypothetical protein